MYPDAVLSRTHSATVLPSCQFKLFYCTSGVEWVRYRVEPWMKYSILYKRAAGPFSKADHWLAWFTAAKSPEGTLSQLVILIGPSSREFEREKVGRFGNRAQWRMVASAFESHCFLNSPKIQFHQMAA